MEALPISSEKKQLRLRDRLMLKGVSKKDKRLYWLAFLIPMCVLELAYITFQIFPFGNGSLLVLDLNAQYIYYYEAFRDAVLGDGSLIYSWSRTLGGETFGLNAYYMGSPFMLIFVLFPKKLITEALLTTALLKTGCASLSLAYYLRKTRGGENVRIVIFSTTYALMTYMVMQQMDPMWLDAVIGLPIIMLGLERMMKSGKYMLYTISLALVIYSNFYIGYMVAIFTTMYFFYAYFTTCTFGPGNGKRFFKKFGQFALFSIIAGAAAAVMIIPAYFSLSLGKLDFSNPSYALTSKFRFLDILPKFLFGAYDTCRPEGLPTLYCGTATLMLIPLYYANKNVNLRRKIMTTVLLLVLFLSMNMSTVDLVWHGFQNPNWLNYRYSFMVCLLMIIMAYDAFANVKGGYTVGSVGISMLVLIGLAVIVDKQQYEYVDTRITVWSTMLAAVVYFALLGYDAYKHGKNTTVCMGILLGVICAELYLNAFTTLVRVDEDVVFSDRSGTDFFVYRNFVDGVTPAAEWLEEYDTGFYRTEKTFTRCVNDNMAFGFKGISHSSSTLNRDGINYISSLGYSVGAHWTRYVRPIIATDAILGIKYVLQREQSNNGLTYLNEVNGIYIYQNEHAMPLCFPVDALYSADEGDTASTITDPFERQNRMLSDMVGSEELIEFYRPLDESDYTVNYVNVTTKAYGQGYTKYSLDEEGHDSYIEYMIKGVDGKPIYAAFPNDYARKINIWINKVFYSDYLKDNSDDGVISVGQYSAGEQVSLRLSIIPKDQSGSAELFLGEQLLYCFDSELFESYFAPIRDSVQNFTELSTTHLTMDVTASEGQTLYMSIPYERGWNVKIDGEAVEVYRTDDGLVGIDLPEGTHSIDLRFLPDYFVYSCIISASAVLLLLLIYFTHRYMIKKGIKPVSVRNLLKLGDEDEAASEAEVLISGVNAPEAAAEAEEKPEIAEEKGENESKNEDRNPQGD